ncbi:MAG: mercuric reductase [Nitrospiraceae bacterium]
MSSECHPLPSLGPNDEANRTLLQHVHPSDWVNPQSDGRYNLVVLGAGTAGLVTAVIGASVGAKVALVERALMGGDCLNVGCVPSKALIRAAKAWADVRRAQEFGVQVSADTEFDFGVVMARMRRLRADISPHDSAARYRSLGVDVYIGDGRFVDAETIAVTGQAGDRRLSFVKAVICTGARAAAPNIPGLADVGYLTNETVFGLTERPARLVVIGAGPIGCELAQAFARFGSAVTLLERHTGILPKDDREAAAIVEAALRRDGVELVFGAEVRRVEQGGHDKRVIVQVGGTTRVVETDAILVGVGRAPNVEGLELEQVGVQYDAKGVTVNDHLQTSHPRIFAAGDVCSAYKFTHAADAMAQLVIQNALFPHPFGLGRGRLSGLTIPWATYTQPELAQVGRTAADAVAAGLSIETYTYPMRDVDRARLDGDDEGFVRIHVQQGTDRVVGATIVATHAGDLIGTWSILMKAGLGTKTVASAILPYPTQAEVHKKVVNLWRKAHFTPRMKAWLTRLFAWMRR